MGKAPAFQFYIRDWLADPQLRLASPSTRGLWIDFLCYMWEAPEKGKLIAEYQKLGRMVGATNGDLDLFISEAHELGFCDISVTGSEKSHDCPRIVTLINRRMHREEKERNNARLRKQKQRLKEKENDESQESHDSSHEKVTPLSSSSTSSSKPIDTPNGVLSPEASGDSPDLPKIPQCPQVEIKALYHEILCPPLAPVNEWSPELAKILRTMWREKPERWELTWWKKYFRFVKASDFLMGKKTDFIADLEWIIRPRNRTKILNGRFHNRGSPELKKFAGILEWLRVQEEKS